MRAYLTTIHNPFRILCILSEAVWASCYLRDTTATPIQVQSGTISKSQIIFPRYKDTICNYSDFPKVAPMAGLWNFYDYQATICFPVVHSVWKSQKKSHSTLRAKRATFTFWVHKNWLKMPKMVILASFWKTEACGQKVLPDMSILIEQKLVNSQNWNATFPAIFKYYEVIQELEKAQ